MKRKFNVRIISIIMLVIFVVGCKAKSPDDILAGINGYNINAGSFNKYNIAREYLALFYEQQYQDLNDSKSETIVDSELGTFKSEADYQIGTLLDEYNCLKNIAWMNMSYKERVNEYISKLVVKEYAIKNCSEQPNINEDTQKEQYSQLDRYDSGIFFEAKKIEEYMAKSNLSFEIIKEYMMEHIELEAYLNIYVKECFANQYSELEQLFSSFQDYINASDEETVKKIKQSEEKFVKKLEEYDSETILKVEELIKEYEPNIKRFY